MATSTAPAAIDALLAALRAAPGLTGVDVHDGEPMSDQVASPDWICVGHDPTDPLVTVQGLQVPASLGNRAREESYEIACSLATTSGDTDMSGRRARAMALFAVVEAVVRQNITLSGTVRTAQVSSYSLVQEQLDSGATAGVPFRITCSARLT